MRPKHDFHLESYESPALSQLDLFINPSRLLVMQNVTRSFLGGFKMVINVIKKLFPRYQFLSEFFTMFITYQGFNLYDSGTYQPWLDQPRSLSLNFVQDPILKEPWERHQVHYATSYQPKFLKLVLIMCTIDSYGLN